MVFIPQAQPHAQSLFLFPIVFGINIIRQKTSTQPMKVAHTSVSITAGFEGHGARNVYASGLHLARRKRGKEELIEDF